MSASALFIATVGKWVGFGLGVVAVLLLIVLIWELEHKGGKS